MCPPATAQALRYRLPVQGAPPNRLNRLDLGLALGFLGYVMIRVKAGELYLVTTKSSGNKCLDNDAVKV